MKRNLIKLEAKLARINLAFQNSLKDMFPIFYWIYWWHRLTKLYRFWVHNSTTHHLHTVLCVHHPKSSLLPSPFIPPILSSPCPCPDLPSALVITTLLSVSIRFVFFLSSFFIFLHPFTFFTQPTIPTPLWLQHRKPMKHLDITCDSNNVSYYEITLPHYKCCI